MKKKNLLALLLAVVMVFGAFAPAVSMADEGQQTTEVVVHKIVMNKEAMDTHDVNKEYDPAKGIDNITDFFGDTTAKEVPDVYFVAISSSDIQEKAGEIATLEEAKAYFDKLTLDQKKDLELSGKTKVDLENDENNGLSLQLGDGTWFIFEVPELSTYKDKDGNVLADSKAVPVEITLPLIGENGKMDTVHVYPKNTEDKPKIDKDFEDANANDPGTKETRNYGIGDDVPFHVQTIIPQGAKYKTLKWTDQMSKGLTFNNDIKITTKPDIKLAAVDYSVDARPDGFTLILKDTGLAKVEEAAKNGPVTFDINYTAVLNSEVEIEELENNKVKLHYGNNPTDENEPPEITNTTKIPVTKTWADGEVPAGVSVTYVLYEKVVSNNENDGWKEIARVVKTAETGFSHEFTDLTEGKTYKVVEFVEGYTPEYSYQAEEGEGQGLTITNTKEPENPKPLEPTPVKVTTYGKKFVKTDNGEKPERLAGAEFVVKNTENKYLAMKPDAQKQKENDKYIAFEKAYQEAVNAYNTAAEQGKTQSELEELKAKIEPAKRARDEALKTATHHYYWTAEIDEAHVLISDDQGRFEIKGLAAGTYYLEEIKAPDGYAKLAEDVEFTVGSGSYGDDAEGQIPYTPVEGEVTNDAQKVVNKKVDIPQTGGMGTIILTVAGIALMATAVIALRRNRAMDHE